MKTIPEDDFAVVRDRERGMIVHSGTFDECIETARLYNRIYQSTAYTAVRWEDGWS